MARKSEILAAQAKALVEQVKSMNNDTKSAGESGIDSGAKAEFARKMLEDAKRLGAEAKAARDEETKSLLEDFDGKGAGHVSGDVDLLKQRKAASQAADDFSDLGRPDVEQVILEKAFAQRMYGKRASGLKAFDEKVLQEGTGNNGEFLVAPEYHQELFAQVRTTANALRALGWVNVHTTNSNKLHIPRGQGSTTMGWVGQNTPAPSTDQSTDEIQVDIFTAIGIAKATLQVDADSNPAQANLAIEDLAARAAILEEQTWISGSGSGQAYGILNTPGVLTKSYGGTIDTAQEQIDLVFDQYIDVLTNFFAAATGVLVAPRRYAFWRKAKDSNNNYLFNMPGTTRAPGEVTKNPFDGGDILGLPIGISNNVPINLGGGTNEDRIIVGYWPEAHAFVRLDQQIDFNDKSDTAWANAQTQVRLMLRQGFTAARYPKAFSVGGGAGLAVV